MSECVQRCARNSSAVLARQCALPNQPFFCLAICIPATSSPQQLALTRTTIAAASNHVITRARARAHTHTHTHTHTNRYYRNWLNHTAEEINATGDRLFFNVGRDPLGPAPPPPPAGNKSARVALCRVATACAVDGQGRSCDDWIRELPHHRLNCPLLEAYGHDCAGCSCAASVLPSACDDSRLHCRHDKALRKPVSHYSAIANAAGTAVMRSARIIAIGDTHGQHDRVGAIPPGDVLIHTGDFVSGTSDGMRSEIAAFNTWLGRLPHKRKFFVSGNHDADGGVSFEDLSRMVPNAVQLLDSREEIDLDGDGEGELTVWGAPWQPQFTGFDTHVNADLIAAKWVAIPTAVDIVVTHTPPRGQLDTDERGDAIGCPKLAFWPHPSWPRGRECRRANAGAADQGFSARGGPNNLCQRGIDAGCG
jgi:hypothetical protein